MSLQGRIALVSGGGSGIGRATAIRLAEDGADSVVLDVNLDGARETATRLETRITMISEARLGSEIVCRAPTRPWVRHPSTVGAQKNHSAVVSERFSVFCLKHPTPHVALRATACAPIPCLLRSSASAPSRSCRTSRASFGRRIA